MFIIGLLLMDDDGTVLKYGQILFKIMRNLCRKILAAPFIKK